MRVRAVALALGGGLRPISMPVCFILLYTLVFNPVRTIPATRRTPAIAMRTMHQAGQSQQFNNPLESCSSSEELIL